MRIRMMLAVFLLLVVTACSAQYTVPDSRTFPDPTIGSPGPTRAR